MENITLLSATVNFRFWIYDFGLDCRLSDFGLVGILLLSKVYQLIGGFGAAKIGKRGGKEEGWKRERAEGNKKLRRSEMSVASECQHVNVTPEGRNLSVVNSSGGAKCL